MASRLACQGSAAEQPVPPTVANFGKPSKRQLQSTSPPHNRLKMKYMYVYSESSPPLCTSIRNSRARLTTSTSAHCDTTNSVWIWANLGSIATPRNCWTCLRASRSLSRPGTSSSRVSDGVQSVQFVSNSVPRSSSKPRTRSPHPTKTHNAQGKLTKSLNHLAVGFTHVRWIPVRTGMYVILRQTQPKKNVIKIELHHGSRKSVATLRTVRTLIVRRTHSMAPQWQKWEAQAD